MKILYRCMFRTETLISWEYGFTPVMSGGDKTHPNYPHDHGSLRADTNELRHTVYKVKGAPNPPVFDVGAEYLVVLTEAR